MRWRKKLTQKELKHIRETTERGTKAEFLRNRAAQVKEEKRGWPIPCFECRIIARKLGTE